MQRKILLGLLCLAILLGTAGCAVYHPRQLNPPQLENQYRARTLTDQKVRSFVEVNFGEVVPSWPPKVLDLRTLTLVGYYYSPDLEIARSQIAIADAGIRAAGARINPTLGLDGGYNANPDSRLSYGVLPAFTIETAGKRGSRIFQAEKQAEAARIGLAEAGWLLRSGIRTAFYNHVFSARRRNLLQAEENIRSEIVEIFDKRLAAGEAAGPEVDIFRVDLITTEAALQIAIGDVAQTRSALANVIGLPTPALEDFTVESATLDSPPTEQDLPILKIQRAGLLHRADLRRTLADYAATDAALKLEIARQFPDLVLSPGYTFEEGFARYVLSASIQSIPLFHRNQGLIAVAEAQRRQAGERFEALQSQAIGQMERALVQYRAGLNEWREASERLVSVQRGREEAARRALAAGEGDRLGLATVRLQTIIADRAWLDALNRVYVALGALEDSMQQALEAPLSLPDPAIVSPRKGANP
jgi:outer membrane protein TolC